MFVVWNLFDKPVSLLYFPVQISPILKISVIFFTFIYLVLTFLSGLIISFIFNVAQKVLQENCEKPRQVLYAFTCMLLSHTYTFIAVNFSYADL